MNEEIYEKPYEKPTPMLIIYTTDDGKSQIQLLTQDQTVWLTQLEMAELFAATKQNISLHLKNLFEDGELDVGATVKESLTVQTEGERQVQRTLTLTLYNLDAILAVGYRVRSPRGVQFRRFASTILREYLHKGFVMNDERLKNPDGRPDHFDDMQAPFVMSKWSAIQALFISTMISAESARKRSKPTSRTRLCSPRWNTNSNTALILD